MDRKSETITEDDILKYTELDGKFKKAVDRIVRLIGEEHGMEELDDFFIDADGSCVIDYKDFEDYHYQMWFPTDWFNMADGEVVEAYRKRYGDGSGDCE